MGLHRQGGTPAGGLTGLGFHRPAGTPASGYTGRGYTGQGYTGKGVHRQGVHLPVYPLPVYPHAGVPHAGETACCFSDRSLLRQGDSPACPCRRSDLPEKWPAGLVPFLQ